MTSIMVCCYTVRQMCYWYVELKQVTIIIFQKSDAESFVMDTPQIALPAPPAADYH